MNSPRVRKRKFARRSKTGCQWCKKKHIRCDEQKPVWECERGPSSNANSNTHVTIVEPRQIMGDYPLLLNSYTGSSFEVPFQLPFPQCYPGLELYSAVAGVLNDWQAGRDACTNQHAHRELGMLTSPEFHEIRLELVPTAQAFEFGLQAMSFPNMDGSAATAEVHPHLNAQDTVFSMVTY
ncbi:hypothetical protein BKA56DRAFT_703535 [Ilyonectria sp. MPI-CAGE-AT-0026]|nr:hypothetical protein BKA56DRAFT_703535 [Ilyonectria sp. MPI-CAGE-AT-0026]